MSRPGMSHQQIVTLLQLLACYDRRTVGEGDVHAWHDAAQRARWTAELATEAVKDLGATSTAWIKPGHVTEWIRSRRRPSGPGDEPIALPPVSPATAEHRRRQVERFASDFARRRSVPNVPVPDREMNR